MTARPSSNPLSFAPVMDPTSREAIALEYLSSEIEDIFTANAAHRDADAAAHGEPTADEFWHGRAGERA
jgi:hypothetical protein